MSDEVIKDVRVDLILVKHLADCSDKTYLFQAPPCSVYQSDIVDTKLEGGTAKTLAKVVAIYRNINPESSEYDFICKTVGIKKITGTIPIRYEKEIIY